MRPAPPLADRCGYRRRIVDHPHASSVPERSDRLLDAFPRFGAAEVPRWRSQEVAAQLLERYSEPHRRYHTVEHLDEVLTTIDSLGDAAADLNAVLLAAWFHDAVYDPTRTDNEALSAELARVELAELAPPPSLTAEVVRLVLSTATHAVESDDRNGALLHDADLAILASSPARYDRYSAAIRAEYAHIDDEQYRSGRAAVLRSFLARDPLYLVGPDVAERTARAHANLERELEGLSQATL